MAARSSSIPALCFILSGFVAAPLHAAPPCDDHLIGEPQSWTGYRLREPGVRCEGFYQAQVSRSRDLELVGLMRGRLRFDPAHDRTLALSSPIRAQPVRIRGVAIPDKTYYRLDGLLPAGGTFRWNLADVVLPRRLKAEDLGLYGDLFDPPQTYVPLALGGGRDTTAWIRGPDRYAVVQWRSAPGRRCKDYTGWRKLTPPGSAAKAVEILLPLMPELCLEVAARPVQGGEWVQGSWRIRTGE